MAAYLNQAPQQVSITLGSTVTSNTATITAVGANAFLVYQGFTCDATADNLQLDEFATGVLTNSTTVTVTRTTGVGSGVFNFVVIDPTSSLVTGVQAGTIAITAATSNTATITSVDTTLSAVFFLGAKTTGTAFPTTNAGVTLTNATTVTALVNTSPGALTTTVSYVVVTFATAAIQSIQQFVTTSTAASTTDTATITSVTTGNSFLVFGNFTSSAGGNGGPAKFAFWRTLTNGTTVTMTRNNSTTETRTNYGAVVEFKTGVLNNIQRGSIVLSSVASNTATITSVATANSFCSYLGFQSAAAGSAPDTLWHKIALTNATTTTVTRNTAGSTSSTVGYEVVEFTGSTYQPYFYRYIGDSQ